MQTKELLKNRIKSESRRMTVQRLAILEELQKVTSHPSAQDVYVMVQKRIPEISFGTVYRNLKLLEDLGLLQELNYGKSFSRYDGNPINHYHISCEKCGRMDDIPISISEKLDRETSDITGYSVRAHRIEFYGLCQNCQEAANNDVINSKG
ncbi:MAG: Fur family transcriptional regulator [Actinomycetota bacterium]